MTRVSILAIAVGRFVVLFYDIAITSRQFFLDGIVCWIAATVTQSAPGTGRRIVVRFLDHVAVGIGAGTALLAFGFAGLLLWLLTRSLFLSGLSRGALLAT